MSIPSRTTSFFSPVPLAFAVIAWVTSVSLGWLAVADSVVLIEITSPGAP